MEVESKIWNEFKKFCKNAELFGTSSGSALIMRGLGVHGSSPESQNAAYSLLYIKMVAIFSDELKKYCDNNSIYVKDDRLVALLTAIENSQKIVLDFTNLKHIRETRNNISHKPSFLITKNTFHNDKTTLDKELIKILMYNK